FARLQPRSHRSYRRRKVTINLQRDNDRSSTIQRSPKKLICPNLWTTSSTSFVPFVDNRLYFDPGSLLRVASPAVDPLSFDHVVPSSRQTRHHHHHHHHRHHHHHHHHHRKHRRVVSDPGTRDWNVSNQDTKRHRRMFSYDTGITGLRLIDEAELAETDRQAPSPDETKTSTFRKVPWHPNLHMLKIRRT
ncbi:transcription factor MafB-like, partial [Frieseomelitta varia]|uniref:transcription factor MafB-like n=1 Tax=Frieseomelitta varia TaxID=561572 RepID=UPI001CB67BF2